MIRKSQGQANDTLAYLDSGVARSGRDHRGYAMYLGVLAFGFRWVPRRVATARSDKPASICQGTSVIGEVVQTPTFSSNRPQKALLSPNYCMAEETSRFELMDKSWGGVTPGEAESTLEKGLGSLGLWEGIDEYFRKTEGVWIGCDLLPSI